MSDIKQAFGTVTTMSVSMLTNLASSNTSGWQSAAVVNTSNLFLDALCQVRVTLAKTNPANDKAVYVYTWGSVDTCMTSVMGTTEGLVTIDSDNNYKLANVMAYSKSNGTICSSPFSISQCFGGILPAQWGLAILNYSGAALTNSTLPTILYRGVYATADTADL